MTIENRFFWQRREVIISPCLLCKNKRRGETCAAYPQNIPSAILSGEHDHTTPFPGDNGIRFEPIDEEEASA